MSWPEQKTEEICKIRKRRCSSSSSSSSSTLVFKYRFKNTPTWKMSTKSHSSNRSPSCSIAGGGSKGKEASVSVSVSVSARNHSQKLKNNMDIIEDKQELMKTQDFVSQISHSCLSDPDPCFNDSNSKKVEGDRVHRRRTSASSMRLGTGEANFHGNHCLIEIENPSNQGRTVRRKTKFMLKTRLKEVGNCLTTSKELIRVLNHVLAHEDNDQHRPSSISPLITALKSEMERAKARVDHLIKDQSLHGDEIEIVMKRFTEEKTAWKNRERARVRSSIASMADEIEIEKKLRRQAERLNKTIAKELAEAKISLSKAMKDLQRERRAKEIFEQICDELAKGIGEDRAQFEEFKKESAKVREEIEQEREMLQLADVLREERVQMKLSEAKYQFEEKNAAVERLKDELEAFLITQFRHENREEEDYSGKIKELEAYLKKINFGSVQEHLEGDEKIEEQECSEEDDSDLHSIELNMDNNNKSYRWSFVHGGSKRNSFEKDQINGRKSVSEKIQWGSICLNRKASNGSKNGEFVGRKSHESSERLEWERFTEVFEKEGDNGSAEKKNTKSGKCLRDILFPGFVEPNDDVGIAENVEMDEAS
ncbi:hypothetical protein SDJN02_02723 [Cucurbita argyrosperma subsp. argyrosperma]|nr:hypothetical protein SDJN02_02723 [Cucurbita argyrosperma subsp. argyrosperma]